MTTDAIRGARSLRFRARVLDALIVFIAIWTAWQFFASPRRSASINRLPPIQLKSTLTLPGIDWSRAPRHIVLAMTLSCKFCQSSADLYKRLSEWVSAHPEFSFIVVAPESESGLKQWMMAKGVLNYSHVKENFHLRGFRYTPTIVLVDQSGAVTDMVVGKMSADEEDELFNRLAGHGSPLNIDPQTRVTQSGVTDAASVESRK